MLHLSKGNKKLVSTSDCRFIIWSIVPIITCPFATELCKHFCYANSSWKQYPNVRNAWSENLAESKSKYFANNMICELEKMLSLPSYKSAKRIVIRIHESGDFYSQDYADKWLEIARHFEGSKKVHFMAYTKSVSYFENRAIPKNLTVRFSLWSDTKPSEYAKAKAMGLPVYTAVESFTNEPKKERCECVDCGHCRKCWSAIEMLKCEIH